MAGHLTRRTSIPSCFRFLSKRLSQLGKAKVRLYLGAVKTFTPYIVSRNSNRVDAAIFHGSLTLPGRAHEAPSVRTRIFRCGNRGLAHSSLIFSGLQRYIDVLKNGSRGDGADPGGGFDQIIAGATLMFAAEGVYKTERFNQRPGLDEKTRAVQSPVTRGSGRRVRRKIGACFVRLHFLPNLFLNFF